jgi:cytochrome P450
MPEFFPEPYQFNIDRYLGDNPAHKQPGKFVPYGLGAHTCLGAGTAEIQLMITLGMLLRTARLELTPKDYELKYIFSPLPVPEPNFRMRVVEYRA